MIMTNFLKIYHIYKVFSFLSITINDYLINYSPDEMHRYAYKKYLVLVAIIIKANCLSMRNKLFLYEKQSVFI